MSKEDFSNIKKELLQLIISYAKKRAIEFAESLHPDEDGNHWQMYDGRDRWINTKTNEVLSTEQLYNQQQKPDL